MSEYGQKSRSGGDCRPAECLVDAGVKKVGKILFPHKLEIFTDPVEDNDRIVQGISDYGENGGDHRKVDFPLG